MVKELDFLDISIHEQVHKYIFNQVLLLGQLFASAQLKKIGAVSLMSNCFP